MLPETTSPAPRKVLIIAYYFPPLGLSGVQRILKFTKYLPDFDWQPVVLTVGNTKYYAFDDGLLKELHGKDIPIYRTGPASGHSTSNKYPSKWLQKIGRAILQTVFIPDSRKRWLRPALKTADQIFQNHPDIGLIFATAPPFTDLVVAQKLAQKYNVPFVADYRDLWTDNPQLFAPTPYHRYRHRTLEYDIVRQCRKIIVITRTMKEKLLCRYKFLDYNDITVIPHGFDGEDFPASVAPLSAPSTPKGHDKDDTAQRLPAQSPAKKTGRGKFIVTHCGLFPDSRTPKYFLKAVAAFLRKTPAARQHIELQFVGIMRAAHCRLIKRYKLTDYAVLAGYLPHSEAVMKLQNSDVNWMMIDNNIETPGKFYEYIGATKPILLCAPDGELCQIGRDYKACFTANPKDINKIANHLSSLYSLWLRNNLPTPDMDFVQTFSRYSLTSSLAKELAFAAINNE